MRQDPTQSDLFKSSGVWGRQKYDETFLVANDDFEYPEGDPRNDRKFVSNSLSGNERNRLFLRTDENFADVSLLSGTDDLADARSFALLDFDDDGWLDIALMSLNAPRFKLYKNEFSGLRVGNRVLRIRLVGGYEFSNSGENSKEAQALSNRDAIGARVLVTYESGKIFVIQKQAGEGFGSQNSGTIRVGCPADDTIVKLTVRWPSGKQTEIESPEIEKVLTIKEMQ